MVLQLANHSTRTHRGMYENVLIKVKEFIFPIHFVVLDTEVVVCPKNEISVIIGQPFLTTSNALINCRMEK